MENKYDRDVKAKLTVKYDNVIFTKIINIDKKRRRMYLFQYIQRKAVRI